MKRPPEVRAVRCALYAMLKAQGVWVSGQPVNVSYVAGSVRPAYHIHACGSYTASTSAVLAHVLGRAFPDGHSGWLINAREARSLMEAADRLTDSDNQ